MSRTRKIIIVTLAAIGLAAGGAAPAMAATTPHAVPASYYHGTTPHAAPASYYHG